MSISFRLQPMRDSVVVFPELHLANVTLDGEGDSVRRGLRSWVPCCSVIDYDEERVVRNLEIFLPPSALQRATLSPPVVDAPTHAMVVVTESATKDERLHYDSSKRVLRIQLSERRGAEARRLSTHVLAESVGDELTALWIVDIDLADLMEASARQTLA